MIRIMRLPGRVFIGFIRQQMPSFRIHKRKVYKTWSCAVTCGTRTRQWTHWFDVVLPSWWKR
jgi:hypothetical protein